MGSNGPFIWWGTNLDLMAVCQGTALIASGIVIFIKEARASSVVVALLTSILFTGVGVPYVAIHMQWEWTGLSMLSAGFGFGSMTLAYSAMRVAEVLQKRAESMAIKWGGDKLGLPDDEQDQPKGT
jgi:hypothetical protein